MGGENPQKEKSRLRKGLGIIICTPGRFLYHLQNTQCINFSHLSYLIFDEADRILDLGFEKDMNACLKQIKKRAPQRFNTPVSEDNYWSDKIKINFVSATINKKIEALGAKLMQNYETVGFDVNNDKAVDDQIIHIPKQIQQYYTEVPTQYRLLYLMAFLYAHQHEKIIVFLSNCELVNFIFTLMNSFDWNRFGIRDDQVNQNTNQDAVTDENAKKL